MSSQLMICLLIFILTCIGYMTGVWSLATVAMASVAALAFSGCLTAQEALGYFANGTVIMVGAMCVVAAGFAGTRFCSKLADGISRLATGNFYKVLLLYCLLAMLLSQMVQSPVVVFGIVAPVCLATTDSAGVSRSKAALSLGVVAIATCCTLPIGNGATQAAEFNSYIAAFYEQMDGFSGTVPVMGFLDPMKGRLPMLIFAVLYCALIMPRFCPDRGAERGAESAEKSDIQKADEKTPLSAFSEVAGIVIFFAAAIALMLQTSILSFLAVWQICLTGAVLMVICGVLKPSEAARAIPVSMLLLIVGTLAMAGALSATGAGDLIGGFVAGFAVAVKNNYVIGLIFFFFSFALAQFMSNRGAMLIFYPIAIAACYKMNGDPRGILILIEAGALTAFMTPMPTAAVPSMMEAGGYTQGDLIRGGWLFAVLGCVVCVGWIMSVMPIL